MRRNASIGLVAGLVTAAVIVGLLLSLWYPLPPSHQVPAPSSDNVAYYNAKVVLSLVNITLLLAILYIYFGIYSQIKSKVTVGQIFVMLSLLAYAITSNPALQLAFGFRAEGLGPFAMIPDLFTAIAMATLLEMSLE